MALSMDNYEEGEVKSLKDISLFSIVTNFDKIYAALVSSECNIPWKHREFLTRFFSEAVFRGLKSERLLKPEFLDILINPHVRNLDIQDIDTDLIPHVLEKLETHGKTMLSLKAYASDVRENLWEPLMSSLPNLEHIYFKDVPSRGAYEAVGRNCASLKILEIDPYCSFYFSGYCTYAVISVILNKCTQLEILQHPDTVGTVYTLHKNDFPLMMEHGENVSKECRKYRLTSLSSTSRKYPLHDALEVCAVMCPYVTHLRIDELTSSKELQKISLFNRLEALEIKFIHAVSVNCFNEFLKISGSKLLRLELPHAPCLSVADLIETCPQLRSLKLHGDRLCTDHCSREDLCKVALFSLENLEYSYGHFEIQENAKALKLLLSAAKNIRKISLHGSTGLTNEFVKSLEMYRVRELDVRLSDIKVESLMEVLLHGSLQVLEIKECKNISVTDYESLVRCSSEKLRNVDIRWSQRISLFSRCSCVCCR